MARPSVLALGVAAALPAAGCAGPALPDPRRAVAEYAAAAQRGDYQAVHSMLTDEAQRTYGLDGTRRLLADSRAEIVRQAKAVGSPNAEVTATVDVPYLDGEHGVLVLEGGEFRVSAADGLPSVARTPEQALGELRGALARRSYAALLRVLSKDTRGTVEADIRSLVGGLEHPDSLDVRVRGETAEVEVPGGHKVVLKREAGIWRVQDFD